MNRNQDKSMEGISRIDAEKAKGWYLRIYYKDKQNPHAKFFSDGVYGCQEKALMAAKKYRKEYTQKNPPPPKLPFHRKKPSNNTSGVLGVSETYTMSRNGTKIPCFSVFWAPRRNERRIKKFYHHHYPSREAAFKAAVEFRRERELERLKNWARQRGQPLEKYLEALER